MKSPMAFLILFIISLFFLLPFNCSTINTVINYEWDITVYSGTHGSVCNEGTRKCDDEDSLVLMVCSTDFTYQFKEWVIDSGKENCIIENRYSDTTKVKYFKGPVIIHPEFSVRTYSLKFVSDSEGIVSIPVIDGLIYNSKTKINATATAKDTVKYEFNGWSLESGNAVIVNDSIVIAGNTILRAKYTTRKYPLTLTQPTAGGTISSSPASGASYDYGTFVTLTATPATGWHFVNWTGGTTENVATNPLITTIGTSNNISAVFARNQYTLHITSVSAGGVVSPASGDHVYDYGTSVTLTARPDTGYRFVSWSGASSSTASSIPITITKDTTIGTVFNEISVPSGVICVWPNSPSATKNGSDWVHAFTNLYDAISNSLDNSEIWVMQGTYLSKTTSYIPKVGSKIIGGFTGFESALTERNWQTHPTILSGDGQYVYAFNIANDSVVLNGLTLTNYTNIGLYCSGDNTQIINCCIKNSTGASAVYLRSNWNTVYNCIFKNNGTTSVSIFGKALYLGSASKNNTILNSIFFQNGGPAIRDDNTDKTGASKINNCTIVKNGSSSSSSSGGLMLKGATVLNADIVYYNTNSGSGVNGRQIDSTYEVTVCAIQITDSKDTTGCDQLRWSSVTSADPAFVANIPNTDLTALADSTWYSKVNTNIPLLLNSTSPLLNKYYSGGPTSDIRGVTRGHYFDVGAYESANPNQ